MSLGGRDGEKNIYEMKGFNAVDAFGDDCP